MMSFNQYINETKNIYGFENEDDNETQNEPDENLINGFKAGAVIEELLKHPVNNKMPREQFVSGSASWGGGPGMILCETSPHGSDKIKIRVQIEDLEGSPCWLTKKIIPLTDKYRDPKLDETAMAYELLKEISKIDMSLLEKPIKGWPNLEKLVFKLSSRVRAESPDLFIYEGLLRQNPYLYLICLGVRGQGVQARGQERIEEFTINISYSEANGIIRCWGNDVASSLGQHEWRIRPSNWDEYFSPAQDEKEIISAIINALKCY